ncbi:Formamidopyrimidine-DNA glycosylase [hydrothermal vent metagenome]|uniref:Formamidopyrimidine-DNA glycosylase n=1 Tax=hydrothermal vent metagenome TaxID=652676 RepID=A0A3B0YJJ5_9ZZZZ
MPELPEVETTKRGIEPYILGKSIQQLVVRQSRLRWPVPKPLARYLKGQQIERIARRGKYLLLSINHGTLIIHLGMSGSLRMLKQMIPPGPHDHVDLAFSNGSVLRYTDPRRFGAWLWTAEPVKQHPLLINLGPEPLSTHFNADYLYHYSSKRKQAIKAFIMNAHTVVGIGNIYANESLFRAGIHPSRAAGCISQQRYEILVDSIKNILQAAIEQGGTTLRDFVDGEGKPGYFQQQLQVYGCAGNPCRNCGAAIKEKRLSQRSTFYCSRCQH